MNIKTKKQNPDGIVRLEASGQIKEILVDEDLLNPKKSHISLCFRGERSSGIVEITQDELESLYKNTIQRMGLKKIKIIK